MLGGRGGGGNGDGEMQKMCAGGLLVVVSGLLTSL